MKLTAIVVSSGLLLTGLLAFTPTATACVETQAWCAMIYVCPETPLPAWDLAMCEAGYALSYVDQVGPLIDYVRCDVIGGPACNPLT